MYSTFDLKANLLGTSHIDNKIQLFIVLICLSILIIQLITIYISYTNKNNEYTQCIDIIKLNNINFDCNEHFRQINCYTNLLSNPDLYKNKTYICH